MPDFFEQLPDSCPPASANKYEYPRVLRLVDANTIESVGDDEFLSYAALGERRPNANPCKFAACSLFESEQCEGFKAAIKLPKLRKKSIAVLKIPANAGMSERSSSGHISFWRFSSFEPSKMISEVLPNAAA